MPESIYLSHSYEDYIGSLASVQRVWQTVPRSAVRSARPATAYVCVGSAGGGYILRCSGRRRRSPPSTGNNDSCVLRIDDGRFRVMLIGDIEAPAERALLRLDRSALRAEVHQMLHHGSKTASTATFLGGLAAGDASLGRRYSPWRLPDEAVVHSYRRLGIRWSDTAVSGQLNVRFYARSFECWSIAVKFPVDGITSGLASPR